jgi:hypothetical protein
MTKPARTILELIPMTFEATHPVLVEFAGFKITETGELVLYDAKGQIILRLTIANLRIVECG